MSDTSKLPQVNGAAQLVRPSYSPGLMLQDDDLQQAVDYTRDLSRLLFKSLFGCGVVCGFKVTIEPGRCGDQVVIEPGVAIDGNGDPVQLKDKQTIELGADIPAEMWITIGRRDIHCLKRDLACAADDDDTAMVTTRIRDGYEIRLVGTRPGKPCICVRKDDKKDAPSERAKAPADDECYKDHYAGVCSCGCGPGSDDVVLARLYRDSKKDLKVDYGARRFIRPALIVDPEPAQANAADAATAKPAQ